MEIKDKLCSDCIYFDVSWGKEPCKHCEFHDRWVYKDDTVLIGQMGGGFGNIGKFMEEICGCKMKLTERERIEMMKTNMSIDEFIGFLRISIMKYICEFGQDKSISIGKEATKIRRYAEWMEQISNGLPIKFKEE